MKKLIFLVCWVCLIFVFSGGIHAEANQHKKPYGEGLYKDDRTRDRDKKGRYSQPKGKKKYKDDRTRDRDKKSRYSQPRGKTKYKDDRTRDRDKDGTYSERPAAKKPRKMGLDKQRGL